MIAVKMSETPSTNYSVTQPHTTESDPSLSARPFNVTDPIVAKRICFYKSGDPQFNGVKMVVNSRSFKSFDALLDNLSKRVPLPFGVRNITTPQGIHSITNLDDLEDGKSYICSQQKKIKPINLEKASKKPLTWQISRPVSARRKAVQLAREGEDGVFQRGRNIRISTPKKLLVFKNGDARNRRTIVLGKKNTQNFEAFLDNISELMQYPVVKLYTTDGRKVPNLQALILCSGAVVAAGREPFKPGNYDPHRYSLPSRLPGISNRVYPKTNAKSEGRKNSSSRSQIFSTSSYKAYSNDNDSASSYEPDNDTGLTNNHSPTGKDLCAVPSEDDIEKSVHLNQDGTMTVEMRVRFKIKEEETIKWTTTVSRAGFSTDRNVKTGTSAMVAEDYSSELNFLTCKNIVEDFNSVEEDIAAQQLSEEVSNKDSVCGLETDNYDIWQNPSMNIESNNEEVKPHFYRPPTPGPRRHRQKKARVESVTVVSDTAVQKEMVGQFSYSEETDTGEAKSEYCLVTHSSHKTTKVNNLTFNKVPDNQGLRQSLEEEGKGEMSNNMYHETTTERAADLSSEDGLLQNVLEKSPVQEGLHNSITSDCDIDTSHAESSVRNYPSPEEVLANQRVASAIELNHSELSQSKRERMICSLQQRLSQVSMSSSPDESHQSVCHCAEMTTTMTAITARNSSVESITTHLSDENPVASSSSKKKKKKKKKKKSYSDIMEQGGCSPQSLHDIPMEGNVENGEKACEMYAAEDATPPPSSQITAQKRELPFLVHNANDSYKSLDDEEGLHSQVSMNHQQNESNLERNLESQRPKVRHKLDKKPIPSQEDLLSEKDYSKNGSEHINKGIHDSTNITVETPFGIAPQKPMNETVSGHKEKTKKGKSFKRSVKQKKVKKNKKMEFSSESQAEVSDGTCTLDAFRHEDEIAERSLESYVQSWLQNIFPGAVTPAKNLAPINSNDRKMHLLSDTSFSDKENQLEGKNVYVIGNNIICEDKLFDSTLNHLNEIGIVEESFKDFHEKCTDCSTAGSFIDEAQSDIHNSTEESMCDIVHENDSEKTASEGNSQCLSDDQRTSTQVDPKDIDNIIRANVQMDCVNSLLLHQLKSAMLNIKKDHIECAEKSCCLTNMFSPSLLGSSSDLILAWLLVQNFKESLSRMNNDDIGQSTHSYSEIVALFQQYLEQVTVKEEVEALKNDVSNVQENTGKHLAFSEMQTDIQEPAYYQENLFPIDTENLSDFEEQGKLNKTLKCNGRLDSEEVTDANELIEELESPSKSQENCSTLTDNSHLDDLDNHSALQDLNCGNDLQFTNCGVTSDEELPKENGDTLVQDSQDRNTDTSFNNEESGVSEEPNSTSCSPTSIDKDHIFDLETSELDVKSTEEPECSEPPQKEEHSSEHLSLIAENAIKSGGEKDSIQESLKESGTCEEPSELLTTPSPLSFCYESKQVPMAVSVEEPISRVKLMVKELESRSCSNSPLEFRRAFKSPSASDFSDYPPDSERSNNISSGDLTNGSTEETIFGKYNRGYVKRTIERLYGKAEVPFKPVSKLSPPYMSQMVARDPEDSGCPITEEDPSLCQANHSWSDEKTSSLTSSEIPKEIDTISNVQGKECFTWPAPPFNLNGKETCHNEEGSVQSINQYYQSKAHNNEDEGVLIDKGKWLLKENHLIRRSPPENLGMYSNIDTTSAETVADYHSDNIPYSHFRNLDRRPPLKEISSSEIEDMVKAFDNGCNYFNMPHNSESEPFPDGLSIKSKHKKHDRTLAAAAARKECTTPPQSCVEVISSSPSFASKEFRLPDNKVHPLEQPPKVAACLTQPTSSTRLNRIHHEDQSSLDKLHAICGLHCPILMAIVKPTNEEVRRCVYQKASDIENQLDLYFVMDTLNLRRQGKDVNQFGKHADLKDSSINKIANNIFNRFYADNTLEFMNENNFGLLMSTALKENKSLKKFYARENMDVDAREFNDHENHATKEVFREMTVDQYHDLSVLQSSRSNVNHVAGVEPALSFADVMERCKSETIYSYETFVDNIDWNATVNLEDDNAVDVTEETHSYVLEEESNNDNPSS